MQMKEQQPPLSVQEQIRNLQNNGLIVNNPTYAETVLTNISYFRLIKAYSLGLKPKNGNYFPNVTFEQIVSLYEFNASFRQNLFPVIEQIEITLRCRLANFFSTRYGVLGYKNAENFQKPEYHRMLMADIQAEENHNANAPFVKNFKQNYKNGDIPMYAIVELFTFGTLSKFFKNMKNKDKKEVASSYGVGYTYFESWIESIAYVRNICAHYGRLYNAKIAKRPMQYQQYISAETECGRIYDVLPCMGKLVAKKETWVQFVHSMQEAVSKFPYVQVKTMGFPADWAARLLTIF